MDCSIRGRSRPNSFQDERRDQQLQLLVEGEDPECRDPLLAIPPLGQVQPSGGVHQEMQHSPKVTDRLMASLSNC